MRGSSTDNNQEESRSQADWFYTCPKCGSNAVREYYPEIRCLNCGYSEPLLDFPISWEFHRCYCVYYGTPDPGSNEPPQRTLEELHQRLKLVEEQYGSLAQEELKALRLSQLKDELDQLRLGLRFTQRLIPRKSARKRAPKRVITTEV